MAGCIEYRVELHVDFVIMSGDVLGVCAGRITRTSTSIAWSYYTKNIIHMKQTTGHSGPPSLHPSPCPFASSHFSDQTGRLADGLAPRPISRGPKRATRRNEY